MLYRQVAESITIFLRSKGPSRHRAILNFCTSSLCPVSVKHHNTVSRALRYLIASGRVRYDSIKRLYIYISEPLEQLKQIWNELPKQVSFGHAFCRVREHPVDNIVPFLNRYAFPKQVLIDPPSTLALEWNFPCKDGFITVMLNYYAGK